MIQEERIKKLNNNIFQDNKFILYWMQASQRTKYNHALEYAIQRANILRVPLVVIFCLTDNYPEANLRHYYFMIQGLNEVEESLKNRGIKFIIQRISPDDGVINFSKNCCLIIVDRGYLRIQRRWRKKVAENIKCPFLQVESDVVVPIEESSIKEEYAAYTLRPKIDKKLSSFLIPVEELKINNESLKYYIESLDISNVEKVCFNLNIDNSVKPISFFKGGFNQAKIKLDYFIKNKLDRYNEEKNDPNLNCVSDMSPYLHFGQISPIFIALEILKSKNKNVDSYLEELIVRRELSMNYVFYNKNYDSFNGLPNWAKQTLINHSKDERDYIYTLEQLEKFETHDPYWNACQKQMITKGKMHGYMRMYWGKKIIEWTKNPINAFDNALYLNNKYELDGRDPNAFTGISWCFGKHDRTWFERPIFSKIRYMNDKGLKRKFDMDKYIKN
jgi:deoxyribodipyrimidine photo-lyase